MNYDVCMKSYLFNDAGLTNGDVVLSSQNVGTLHRNKQHQC